MARTSIFPQRGSLARSRAKRNLTTKIMPQKGRKVQSMPSPLVAGATLSAANDRRVAAMAAGGALTFSDYGHALLRLQQLRPFPQRLSSLLQGECFLHQD